MLNNENSKIKNLFFVFKILSGVFLVYFLYQFTVTKNIFEHLESINYFALACGMLMTFPIIVVRATRWRQIVAANNVHMSCGDLFKVYIPSFTLGLVTPGKAGEIIRCQYLYKQGLSGKDALITLFVDRLFDIVPTVIISVSFYILHMSVFSNTDILGSLAKISGFIFLITALFVIYHNSRKKLKNGTNVGARYSKSLILKCANLSFLSILFQTIQVHFFSMSVGLQVYFWENLGFASLSAMVSQVPIGIGGVGSRDFVLVELLQQAGFSTDLAFLFAQTFNLNFVFLIFVGFCLSLMINRKMFSVTRKREALVYEGVK